MRPHGGVVAVLAGLALSSLLSGCLVAIPLAIRDTAVPGPTQPPSSAGEPGTAFSSPQDTEVLTADIAGPLRAAMSRQVGVHVETSGSGRSQYVADVDLSGEVEWEVVERHDGDTFTNRYVGGVVYLRGASDDAQWGVVDAGTPTQTREYAEWLQSHFDVLAAVDDAIAGERFTVSRVADGTVFEPVLQTGYFVAMTVSTAGLPTRLTVEFANEEQMTFTFTDWNRRVTIAQPSDVGPITR